MKLPSLNITPAELSRQLLLANSYFAHYKGSTKAVKLLLNMLGFTCIVFEGNALLTRIMVDADDIPTNLLEVTLSNGYRTSYNSNDKAIYVLDSTGYAVDSRPLFYVNIVKTDVRYPYVELTFREYAMSKLSISLDALKCIIKSIGDALDLKSYSFDGTMINYTTKTSMNVSAINVIITNASDADLTAAKTILVKQLKEIVPLNKLVDESRIKGCDIHE